MVKRRLPVHHLLVILEWVFCLSSITIGILIFIAWMMATVRALLGDKNPQWSVADIAVAEAQAAKESYWHRALVALDIFLNVVVLRGQQDETISTHSWRAANEGHRWGKAMTWWLDMIQPNHGQKAASGDLERAMVRVAMLKKALGIN